MPARTPETRTKRRLEFTAEGENGTLPRTFSLVRWDTPQQRDRRAHSGWADTGPPVYTVITGGITRRELEAFLADGISWLAYTGED